MDVKEANPFLLVYKTKNVSYTFFDLKKVNVPSIDYLLVDPTSFKFLLKLLVLNKPGASYSSIYLFLPDLSAFT